MNKQIPDEDMLDWLTDMIRELAGVSRARYPELANILDFAAITAARSLIVDTLAANEAKQPVLSEFRLARRA